MTAAVVPFSIVSPRMFLRCCQALHIFCCVLLTYAPLSWKKNPFSFFLMWHDLLGGKKKITLAHRLVILLSLCDCV